MLVENQYVEIKWHNSTKRWYVDKGYAYTKNGDVFMVNIKDLTRGSGVKVKVKCDYCGEENLVKFCDYLKNTKNETRKCSCAKCSGKKHKEYNYDKTEYFNRFCEMCVDSGYEVISTVDDYKNAHSKLKFRCPVHGDQEITYVSMYVGCRCNLCGFDSSKKKNALSIKEITDIVEGKNGNSILNPEDYENYNVKNLRILCGSCKTEFVSSLSSIVNGDGACYSCGQKKSGESQKLTSSQVENIINSTNNNILLNPEDYLSNSTRNLQIKCGGCGEIYVTSLSNYCYFDTTRCRKCSLRTSKGELIIKNFLDDVDIIYEEEKRFDDCRDKRVLPFDFYLPDYNTCIEFDGQQHYEPKFGQESFERTQNHDKMKNEYCENSNIKLIRIPYWEGSKIKEILTKELKLKTA